MTAKAAQQLLTRMGLYENEIVWLFLTLTHISNYISCSLYGTHMKMVRPLARTFPGPPCGLALATDSPVRVRSKVACLFPKDHKTLTGCWSFAKGKGENQRNHSITLPGRNKCHSPDYIEEMTVRPKEPPDP
ncbi:hypothetical protein H0E87_005264 [Populus deltoides]|uniref:Uncharacterized protein n=1 Tax=Populus deltoides TaxID=3696 RepID=A0A8T2ZIL9_POPDE|nr:hypothetical protein H0E87_005264 [Populus deltoides]